MSAIFPEQLGYSGVILRRLRDEDAESLCSYRSLPEVSRYQSWESFGMEDATRLIEGQRGMEPGMPGKWFQMAIVETESESMIGDCGLYCREKGQMEVGITLAPSYQGRGYGEMALRCLLDYVFETLQAHRVMARTDTENAAAVALFRKLGFRLEARFLERLWFKGRWGSEFVFAMLAREWQAREKEESFGFV